MYNNFSYRSTITLYLPLFADSNIQLPTNDYACAHQQLSPHPAQPVAWSFEGLHYGSRLDARAQQHHTQQPAAESHSAGILVGLVELDVEEEFHRIAVGA
jgi:hypothetical protein